MPKLQIKHNSSKAPDEVFTKIRNFFETDVDLKKIDSGIVCQFDPNTKKGTAKGSQFSAQVSVSGVSSGTEISVEIEIPFLLSAFKGKIQETVQRKLEKYLA